MAAGFVAQMKGTLTNKHYRLATIYVVHYRDLAYVHHLQQDSSNQEKLKGKLAFKQFGERFGVRVTYSHTDNGRFEDNAIIEDLKSQGKTITYCGVRGCGICRKEQG